MDTFVDTHLCLLAKEREEELSEGLNYLASGLQHVKELEERGCLVCRLVVESQRIGLFGRSVVGFERRWKQKIPVNTITSGDIVAVFANGRSAMSDKLLSGVVTKSTEVAVIVAFEEVPEAVNLSSLSGQLQLVKLANDVTYRRLKRALESLPGNLPERCGSLINVLFGEKQPGPPNPKWNNLISQVNDPDVSINPYPFHFFNPSLDSSQQQAVLFALSRPDVAIIHGPPGTGKTTTVVELILQCIKLKEKVLACAPSNIAVDNLVERLASKGAKVVRLGHPARLVSSVIHHSLDSLLNNYDGSDIVKDIRKEMSKTIGNISSSRGVADKRRLRNEVKTLKKELLQREEKILKAILSKADVILTTNTGASTEGPLKHLPKSHFNVVVIDECAQSLEASCWIPLSHAPKCVLAGDHKQLPPTILSKEAAKKGLSVTLMERLVKLYGDQITTMLTTQYRMHQHIMEWPSQYLYDGALTAHSSVADHLLKGLPAVVDTPLTSCPMLFIDTGGCGLYEREAESEQSKGNDGEAEIVVNHIKELLECGVPPHEISVIAPYNLQVDIIKQMMSTANLSSSIEVHTVDGFQGREKEAVIISFTRSNEKGVIGFLSEQRRTNVAVTRARRHLLLIGDSTTISHDPFIKGLIEYCSSHGEVHSAHQYSHSVATVSSCGDNSTPSAIPTTDDSSLSTRRKKSSKNDTVNKSLLSYPQLVAQYKEKLTVFVGSGQSDSVSFHSLTSAQRKALYEAAEYLGITHESNGEGKDRVVTISTTPTGSTSQNLETTSTSQSLETTPTSQTIETTPTSHNLETTPTPQNLETTPTSRQQKTQQEHETDQIRENENTSSHDELLITSKAKQLEQNESISSCTADLWKCSVCGYVIPKSNRDLHEVRCLREQRKTEEEQSAKKKTSKIEKAKSRDIDKKIAKQKKKESTRKKGSTKGEVEEDLDSLIAEMTQSDSVCSYTECKKSTSMLGSRCEFCCSKFCMSHTVPEIHGCGLEAKRKARERMRRESERPRGFNGDKSLNATKRGQLQRKLDNKIEDLSSDRQRKKKQ